MAQFAIPTPDENLVSGWNVQASGATGPGDPGYGTAGNTGSNYNGNQALAGTPIPAGALNVGAENSGSQTVSILTNNGYANATGPGNRQLPQSLGGSTVNPPAVPATSVVATNPTQLVATVVISGGTLTVVKTGQPGQTFAQATQVGTAAGTYIVQPGGVIGITYSVAPTWTWSV